VPTKTLELRANIQGSTTYVWEIGQQALDATRATTEDAGDFSVQRVNASAEGVYIWQLDTQFQSFNNKTLSLRASIRNTATRSLELRARINPPGLVTVSMQLRANIKPPVTQTMLLRANIRGRLTNTLQIRANIRGTTTRTTTLRARIRREPKEMQLRARINTTQTQTLQLRAWITPGVQERMQLRANLLNIANQTLNLRARILPDNALTLRARIFGRVTTSVEVDYDVRVPIAVPLVIRFDVTGSEKAFQFLTLRARIRKPITSGVVVTYQIPYEMPDDCTQYPTQRLQVRSIRDMSLRCRIRN